MDLVSQFIENYKKKIPFYEAAGRLAASQLESALQSAGIRAMVTSRLELRRMTLVFSRSGFLALVEGMTGTLILWKRENL